MSTVKKILIIAILTIVAATAVFVAFDIANKNNNPEYQLALANKLLEEHKYDKADIAFNKVIDIDDKNIDAYVGLSKVYVKTEDYNEAERVLKKALKIDNKNKDIYEKLIDVYEVTNKYDKISDLIEELEEMGLSAEAEKLIPKSQITEAVTDQIIPKQKIVVATNAEFEPFEYLENNEIVGFDIDLIKLICEELGYEPVLKNMAFEELLRSLRLEESDLVIAGMTATEERKDLCDFSIPYLEMDSIYGGELVHEVFSIAVTKGDPIVSDINECIKKYQQDGTIDRLIRKWNIKKS